MKAIVSEDELRVENDGLTRGGARDLQPEKGCRLQAIYRPVEPVRGSRWGGVESKSNIRSA